MRKIKEVLRLKFEAGLSHERIAAAVGVSKGAVTKYVQRAVATGLGWPLAPELDDAALEALLFPHSPALVAAYAPPNYALTYTAKPSFNLYPTAGASDDYVYSRHIVDPSKGKVYGYVVEWGAFPAPTTIAQEEADFHPIWTDMVPIEVTSR